MKPEEIHQLVVETMMKGCCFAPDVLGEPRVLFRSANEAPLVSLYIDPPDMPMFSWKRVSGLSVAESFFLQLRPIVLKNASLRFTVDSVEKDTLSLRWSTAFSERMWSVEILSCFDEIQGVDGPRFLGLVWGDCLALLLFKLHNGLEITFYGDDELWSEVAMALCYGNLRGETPI